MADDSGLEVEALNNMPGVETANYAGKAAGSEANIKKLLVALNNEKNRRARFVCFLLLKNNENEYIDSIGYLNGKISESPSGSGGFGYDPIFIPDGYSESLSSLKAQNIEIETHRVIALKKLFLKLSE